MLIEEIKKLKNMPITGNYNFKKKEKIHNKVDVTKNLHYYIEAPYNEALDLLESSDIDKTNKQICKHIINIIYTNTKDFAQDLLKQDTDLQTKDLKELIEYHEA